MGQDKYQGQLDKSKQTRFLGVPYDSRIGLSQSDKIQNPV